MILISDKNGSAIQDSSLRSRPVECSNSRVIVRAIGLDTYRRLSFVIHLS
jgi:hypothetical protein